MCSEYLVDKLTDSEEIAYLEFYNYRGPVAAQPLTHAQDCITAENQSELVKDLILETLEDRQ